MRLSDEDAALFSRLHGLLLLHANRTLELIPKVETVAELRSASKEKRLALRDGLLERAELLDGYLAENPDDLSPEELEMVRGWKQAVAGEFCVVRNLKRHTVFVSTGESPTAYGVVGSLVDLGEMFEGALPVYVDAVLLPFRNQIVDDGLARGFRMRVGPGTAEEAEQMYRQARASGGVVEHLGAGGGKAATGRARRPVAGSKEALSALSRIYKEASGLQMPDKSQQRVVALVKDAASLAREAVAHPDDLEAQQRRLRRVSQAVTRLQKVLR